MTTDFGKKFNELYKLFGDDCISDNRNLKCYGKPCACLVCRHEDYFCVEGNPCYNCEGRDEDRTHGFCNPSDEELED